MNVFQTVLNTITVVDIVVTIGTATLAHAALANDQLSATNSEEIKIGDYVRWACADTHPITIAAHTNHPASRLQPLLYQLAVCKTRQKDGDLVLICRTATFQGGAQGLAERDAVHNAILHCRKSTD